MSAVGNGSVHFHAGVDRGRARRIFGSMDDFILEYTRPDVNSRGGHIRTRYIVIAESRGAALALVGEWGASRIVVEQGPAVLEQARKLGLADNEYTAL
jgi:hypothetical protein